jgi:mycothiol synthase
VADRTALPFPPGTRALRPEDADPILAAALASLERGELEGVNRHFLEESADRLRHEPELGAVAVEGERVVGWVVPRHDDLTVDLPYRRRGHGTRLVAAGRLLEAAEGHEHLRLWVPRRPDAEGFARAAGLRYHSSLWKLRLDPAVEASAPSFPENVVVRWIEPRTDDAAFTELLNTTFARHPSPLEVDLATIQRVHGRREFDPSTILLVAPAADPDGLVAFCRVGAYAEDDGRLVGEIKHIGVRREWRGRGLGRELVRWGIAACRERAAVDVYLSVEGENRGALRLYESLGFRPDVEWPHWTIPVR